MQGDITLKPSVGSLKSLSLVRPLYLLPADPLAEEMLIPGFKESSGVDCMVGFFSSEVLASLAPGLAAYIAGSKESLRLLISPFLRQEDQQAIKDGTKTGEQVADERLENIIITEDVLKQHTLKCLSWLLCAGRIEIKVALLKGALFHPKVWLFTDGQDSIAVHGSSNVTYSGIRRNIEQVAVSNSWTDANQKYIVEKLRIQFDRLWANKEENCMVIPIPQALQKRLIKDYYSESPPSEKEYESLYNQAQKTNEVSEPTILPDLKEPSFEIPSWLRYEDGPYEHQGEAVYAWCNAGHRGILEMATGSGKTITAMVSAWKLYDKHRPLLIVVAAPYIPLIQQWCDEIELFGLKPTNLTLSSGQKGRAKALGMLRRCLKHGNSQVEAIVVSHNILCTSSFHAELEKFEATRLLIADEAHNLGRERFIGSPPDFFESRLGLSATPIRQYDEEGTEALFQFFSDVVFKFTLKEAIGICLVEYDYYVHQVELSDDEMDEWYHLTSRIKTNTWRQNNKKPDDYLAKLFRDRRALLETAENKIQALREALDQEDLEGLKHTLIYTSDKSPDQLDSVNSLLKDRGLLYHQLTHEETQDRQKTTEIVQSFQEGTLRVLTAKRVLDEGVNIPQIQKAFILASTTVERQWVQRRGRLLRICKETGKTHAEVHDFIAIPPDLQKSDEDAKKLIESELRRVREFANLARNAGRPDGPLPVIDELVRAAFI